MRPSIASSGGGDRPAHRFGPGRRGAAGKTGPLLSLLLLILVLLPARPAAGQSKSLEAHPATGPIVLDGVLDEKSWRDAPAGGDFVQREPDTGKPVSQRTEVRVVFSSTTLYIGLSCFDDEASKIIYKEMQRDQKLWRDDAVDVVLDTFDDDRNAYLFETNPNGARTDALITDEGRDFNLDWNGVWEVAARKTDEGWFAEMAIPFTTLRFDPKAKAWGFNVLRYVRRRAEQSFWAPILLDADVKRVSQYGALTGIGNVQEGWNLRVKPFVTGALKSSLTPDGRVQGRQLGRRRRRPEVGDRAGPQPRPDRQHRLRRDGGRRPPDEPHPLLALPGGEAGVLPRELGDLRVRPGRGRGRDDLRHERRRALLRRERVERDGSPDEGLPLAADRHRSVGGGGPDRLGRPRDRTDRRLEHRPPRRPDRQRSAPVGRRRDPGDELRRGAGQPQLRRAIVGRDDLHEPRRGREHEPGVRPRPAPQADEAVRRRRVRLGDRQHEARRAERLVRRAPDDVQLEGVARAGRLGPDRRGLRPGDGLPADARRQPLQRPRDVRAVAEVEVGHEPPLRGRRAALHGHRRKDADRGGPARPLRHPDEERGRGQGLRHADLRLAREPLHDRPGRRDSRRRLPLQRRGHLRSSPTAAAPSPSRPSSSPASSTTATGRAGASSSGSGRTGTSAPRPPSRSTT